MTSLIMFLLVDDEMRQEYGQNEITQVLLAMAMLDLITFSLGVWLG